MFDPEKVERKEGMTWDLSEHGGRECVLATDYDRLLELYKKIKGKYNWLRGVE